MQGTLGIKILDLPSVFIIVSIYLYSLNDEISMQHVYRHLFTYIV